MKEYSSLSRVCGIKFILCSAMLIQLIPQSDAQILFREAFSFGAFSDVTIKQDLDTEATYINYSNFTVGATTYAIPEAPGTNWETMPPGVFYSVPIQFDPTGAAAVKANHPSSHPNPHLQADIR